MLKKLRPFFLLAFAFMIFSWSMREVEVSLWKSKFHKIEIYFNKPWELIAASSTKEKTMFGLIDQNDGKSLIGKVTRDVSQNVLPDSIYFAKIKEVMLDENIKNTLLKADDILFHGKMHHRMIFSMQTEKRGPMIQYAYVRRTGKVVYTIQMSFPDKNYDTSYHKLSSEMVELDKNLKIEGQ